MGALSMLTVAGPAMDVRLRMGESVLSDAMEKSLRVFAAKSVIVAEGGQPTQVFRITSGRAVRRRTLLDGRSQLLSVLLSGDFFGVRSIFGGTLTESIEAVTDVTVKSANYLEVLSLAEKDTNVAFWLLSHANRTHQIIENWLTVLTHGTAIEVIAFSLLDLWKRTHRAGGGTIRLPLSQRELGELVGITPPHVCRTIATLRESGAINVHYGSIEILNPKLLEDYAQAVLGFLETGSD
jgi:CRP/FNR family transcriptional regulator